VRDFGNIDRLNPGEVRSVSSQAGERERRHIVFDGSGAFGRLGGAFAEVEVVSFGISTSVEARGIPGEGEGGGVDIGERAILRRGGRLRISGAASMGADRFSISVDSANPEVVSKVGPRTDGALLEGVSWKLGIDVVAGRVSEAFTFVDIVASDIDTTCIFGGSPVSKEDVDGDWCSGRLPCRCIVCNAT